MKDEFKWLELRKVNGWYEYMHNLKSTKAVAVLVAKDNKVLGRFERIPCHFDGEQLCSLTGMVDPGFSTIETAQKELREEAGIICSQAEFEYLGLVRPSKASDTDIHLFALEYKNHKIVESEEEGHCEWVSIRQAVLSKDPLMSVLISRYCLRKGIDIQW